MKDSAVRSRILDVASRLFYEQGYNLTGINQIIAEAEIARASLYNHFPSKTDLLSAYIQEADGQWFKDLDVLLAPIKDPLKRLWGIFDFRMENQLSSNFQGCRFTKISSEVPKEDKEVFKLVMHQKDGLRHYIKQCLIELKPDETLLSLDMLSETIFLLMEGATITSATYKNPEALKNAKKIAKKLLS